MPKYLFIGRYSADAARGVLKEGGSKRRDVASRVMRSVGGTMEAIYWGFGEDDFYVIADLPNHAAATAASLTVSGSGAIGLRTVVLMTAEEVDAARDHSVEYSPPRG